jgi:hypothetical protein
MHPFKRADLLAISQPTDTNNGPWLLGAEDSLSFLRQNASNDEMEEWGQVIYFLSRK